MSKRENTERENDGDSKRLKIEEMEEVEDDHSLLNIVPAYHIEEILRRLGASSSIYIAFYRMSCKSFNDGANKFFDLCTEKGNPNALFESAVLFFETGKNMKDGIGQLEKASKEGHDTTTYLLRLMLVCCQGPDHERQRGMTLIRKLKALIGKKIVDCRCQLAFLLLQRGLWYNDNNDYIPIQVITDHHKLKCKDLLNKLDSIMFYSRYYYECFKIDIYREYCVACV